MKPLFSEDYYRQNWNKYLERVPGNEYINMEAELNHAIKLYEKIGVAFTEEQLEVCRKYEAQKIAERCKTIVMKQLETIKMVMGGQSSFGYTTARQEIEAQKAYRTRFDFNCLQLADFKKKYEL